MSTRDQFTSEVQTFEALDNRIGDFGRHEFNQMKTAAQSLATIVNSDPSGTSHQHALRVSAAAQKFQGHLKKVRGQLTEREQGGLQALSEARKERLGLQTDKAFLPTVTAFQNAPDRATRLQWLAQAAQEGHGPTLAALMETPSFIHGIDKDTLEKHLTLAEQTHAPDLFERREQFDRDRDAVSTAVRHAETLAARAVDLETVEAASQADEAEAALDKATS